VSARGPGRGAPTPRMTIERMLAEADRSVPSVSPQTALEMLAEEPLTVVLDVRDLEEYARCHIGRAVHLSRGQLEFYIEDVLPARDHPVILVDRAGARSLLAGRTLQALGYTRVVALAGGIEAWRTAGLPLEAEPSVGERDFAGDDDLAWGEPSSSYPPAR
jgi:sulfur-carrier protein adenylyltransferase/sulfurtransferase